MVDPDHDKTGNPGTDGITRRSVLRRTGVAGVGLAVGAATIPGTVSAHTVDTIAFCGCSQVVVYGEDLNDGQYTAILYCGDPPDGEIDCAGLTGDDKRVNYEIEDEDCKIIGIVGTTNLDGSEQTFSICNEYGPQQCAEKALDTVSADDLLDCLVSSAQTDSEDRLTITKTDDGKLAEYDFVVTENLREDPDASNGDGLEDGENGDEIDNRPGAKGVVRNGDDTFLYRDDIKEFSFTDNSEVPTRVLINGDQVNLLCDTDLDQFDIDVRSGGCGPEDSGGPPDDGGGPPDDGGGPPEDRGG